MSTSLQSYQKNIFLISFVFRRNVIGGVAGITSDANSLVNYARTVAQKHLLQYNDDIPVELLAQRLCDMKQGYTQFGGTSSPTYTSAMSQRHVVQVYVLSVSPCSMRAMIHITVFSCIIRTHLATTLGGKQHASGRTMARHRAY